MLTLAPGCEIDVHRGPDCIILRVKNVDPDGLESLPLAERVWSVVEQHFTYRVVLELNEVPHLNSHLIGQLEELYRWIREQDGLLRLCGLSPHNQRVLHACGLDEHLPPYRDRYEAFMGRPRQPR